MDIVRIPTRDGLRSFVERTGCGDHLLVPEMTQALSVREFL